MIQIQNVTITHRKDLRTIVQDMNLVLNAGDKAVMIGEEGNGKSTLLKWMVDPGLIDSYAEATGDSSKAGEVIGYLPQELSEENKSKSVYEFFTQDENFWNATPKELAEYARTIWWSKSQGVPSEDEFVGCKCTAPR